MQPVFEPLGIEHTVRALTCVFSFTSRRAASDPALVLVRESAGDLFSADLVLGEVDRFRPVRAENPAHGSDQQS